jgi:hypothetical protein
MLLSVARSAVATSACSVDHSLKLSNIDGGYYLDGWTANEDQTLHTCVHTVSLELTDTNVLTNIRSDPKKDDSDHFSTEVNKMRLTCCQLP